MTERTVEVEVTEEATVDLCDGCGLEVEDGIKYLPVAEEDLLELYAGEWVNDGINSHEYQRLMAAEDMALVKIDTEHGPIHYHVDCLSNATLVEKPVAPSWAELESEDGGDILFAVSRTAATVFVIGAGGIVTALVSPVFFPFNIILGLLGGFFVLIVLLAAHQNAKKPDENLRRVG